MEKKDQLNPGVVENSTTKGDENTELGNESNDKKIDSADNQHEDQEKNVKQESGEAIQGDSGKSVDDKAENFLGTESLTDEEKNEKQPSPESKDPEDTQNRQKETSDSANVNTGLSEKDTKINSKQSVSEDKAVIDDDTRDESDSKDEEEIGVPEDILSDEIDEAEDNLTEKYSKLSKEELVEAIESLVENDDVNYIRKYIGYIKAAFRKLLKKESMDKYERQMDSDSEQKKEEQEDPLVVRFNKAFERYKDKKSLYDKDLEKQKHENLAAKEQILNDLRALIDSDEELKHTYDMFRDLQEKWKQIGPVPQSSKSTLWNNYHFLVEKFFDKVKINKELKDLDLKKNLEAKTELCEKAEELLLEDSITKSFQKLQKLHEAWKEVGPVPKDKKDEVWERFKSATDKLNKRRAEFYQKIREDQEKNYSAKLVLCEKAEAILELKPNSPKKWQENSEKMNELFRVWKTIGFAPRKVNNEVWTRFKTALDKFFKNKKEFFKAYKEQQNENYNQKLNLCMQAEALKDSEDWKKTTEQLIELQKEWKKIGPVPAKFSDKIWKRFRAACDEFFNRKSEYFANINQRQKDNLKKKQDLIEKVKTYNYSDDNNKNLELLKGFQREWMEIGHVPIKEKDRVQNEFRKAIDEQFKNLNISKKAKNTLAFRNKMENVKDTPNADNIINKERNFIINKINHLKSDINLWENNIGFFASSEKADVFKNEFQQKIDKAKQEIEILEEKLKIIKEV